VTKCPPGPSSRGARAMGRDRGLALIAVFKLTKAMLLVAVGLGALAVIHPDNRGRGRAIGSRTWPPAPIAG